MNIFTALTGGGGGLMQILMQAVGAYMRGETPESFMKGLAWTHPKLKGLDLDDLEGTANKLARENGTTVDEVSKTVQQKLSRLM